MHRRIVGIAAVAEAAWLLVSSCGAPPNSRRLVIGPGGGELCLQERSVCLRVPPGSLGRDIELRIEPTEAAPPNAVGQSYEIGPSGTGFLVPASVAFRYDLLEPDAGVNPNVLRVFTHDGERWVPLAEPTLKRADRTVGGLVSHLSPFAVARIDIADAIVRDGGTDAGRPDSGVDAGRADAGTDGGVDAGADAGTDGGVDAGADAGTDGGIDAGTDAGWDAGTDAGTDAGVEVDGGIDAGVDAGTDAGTDSGTDAGEDGGLDAAT